MKETIAEDMKNVNLIARQICIDQRIDIYAVNHAFGTYQVEHSGGLNTSYTLYNHEAVEKILRENPDLLPPPGKKVSKAIAEGKVKITRALFEKAQKDNPPSDKTSSRRELKEFEERVAAANQ